MKPPSITSSVPVTNEASSEARNSTPYATSIGSPSRRSGVCAILASRPAALVAFSIRGRGVGDQLLPVCLRRYIRADEARLALTGGDVGGDGFAFLDQHIGDDDGGAFLGEQPRLGLSHAMGAACDDRHLVLEPHICL